MSCSRRGGRRKTVKNNYDYLKHLHEGESIFVVTKNTHGYPRLATHKKITFRKDPEGNKHFVVDGQRHTASGVTRAFVRRKGATQAFNGPRHLGMCVTRTHPHVGPHVVRLRDLTDDHTRCTPAQAGKLLQLLKVNPDLPTARVRKNSA
jgi:hypothetical protein